MKGVGALATVAGLLALRRARDQDHIPHAASPVLPGLAAFASRLGSVFPLQTATAHLVPLTLAEVADHRSPSSPAGTEHFSLIFRGPREPLLDQGTHALTHPSLGAFPLFIVPSLRNGDAPTYVAIFNRLPT